MENEKPTLLLRAIRGEEVERTPVWFMRQGGRHLPEFRELLNKVSFFELLKKPELIVEASLQPVRRFLPDAGVLYSDILLPAEAMGLPLSYDEGGLHFPNPIRSPEDITRLHEPYTEEEMPFICEAITILKGELARLDIPLIGFCAGPFTLSAYMIEGRPSRNFSQTRAMMHQESDEFRRLITLVTSTLSDFLQAQIKAGCDVVQIFDTWTSGLSYADFRDFALPFTSELIASIEGAVPVIYFTVDAGFFFPDIIATGADAINIDWRTDLLTAREVIPESIGIHGNLDPVVLLAEKQVIEEKVTQVLDIMKGRKRYVFNLGHGVLPQTPPENIQIAMNAVKTHR